MVRISKRSNSCAQLVDRQGVNRRVRRGYSPLSVAGTLCAPARMRAELRCRVCGCGALLSLSRFQDAAQLDDSDRLENLVVSCCERERVFSCSSNDTGEIREAQA